MISLTTYADARDAYRHRDLRQALYDEGDALMHGVIVNLHGAEHAARRRLENRLFRRDTFAWFEAEVIPAVIAEMLTPALAAGRVDLLTLSRQTMINLSLRVAGVDRPLGTADELDHLYSLMDRLARASTVASATGDKAAIIDDGNSALDELAEAFYAPSLARRQALLSVGVEADYPADVLMTLVRNQDHLDLPADTLLREIAYYPWVGSHSTSNQFVHAMHHMFRWLDSCPGDRQRLTNDASWRQRFVHESLRLHPASAVSLRRALADITLKSGVEIGQGDTVAISLQDANCDPLVFGPTAADFDPFRTLPDGVVAWGLSFGHGTHACLGTELAAGHDGELLGAITVMAGAVLAAGARIDPHDPPIIDDETTRRVFGRYPVRLGAISTLY